MFCPKTELLAAYEKKTIIIFPSLPKGQWQEKD